MMKTFLFLLLLLVINAVQAQKGLRGLINAEKSFAAYSVKHDTKDAFLHFLDSTAIIWDGAKLANGWTVWQQREKRPGVLNWQPQYAEIAAAQDFGYTTGPWTFQQTIDDTIAARGQYCTVWHINEQGDWKALIDLGISNTPEHPVKGVTGIKKHKRIKRSADTAALIQAEAAFLHAFEEKPAAAYRQFLSITSIINRTGHLPAFTAAAQRPLLQATPAALRFQRMGAAIASTGDLGYVYGITTLNNKQEPYLRIWRREQDGWKIAVEVVRY